MTQDRGPHCSRRRFISAVAAVLVALTSPEGAWADGAARSGLEIWFVRHAESEINVPNAPRPVPDGGMSYPLTLKGVEQAKALAARLADVPLLAVYTSTHLRAVQTADAIAFQHGLTLSLAPEAIEIDLAVDDAEDPRQAYLELARKWVLERELDARRGAGESFTDVQRRFLPFVRELMNRHALDSGVIVIVSHSATLGLMTPVLAPNVPPDFALRYPLPNTGLIKTQLRDSRLFCTEWAGVPHTDFATAE